MAGRVADTSAAGHSGDHRGLLRPARAAEATARVDAIIVPSARPAPSITQAASLAAQLHCVLVVLCSRLALRHEIESHVDSGVHLVAVEVTGVYAQGLPRLETSAMLVGTPFKRRTDTSAKRNIGLALSRMVGWSNIVFLDDDITVPDPADLCRAAAELGRHDGVGLSVEGYPDNSVVCHAHRRVGGRQGTFVGGGALAVAGQKDNSFFPEIYNEDWFFLLDDSRLRPATLRGVAKQEPYDPFDDPDRARREEFGDVLAEGIFALLDQHRSIQDADESYWDWFIGQRRSLIDDILDRVHNRIDDTSQRQLMGTALEAARCRLSLITPDLCVKYLEAWHEDRKTWHAFLHTLPLNQSVEDALDRLRLCGQSTVRRAGSGSVPLEPQPSAVRAPA